MEQTHTYAMTHLIAVAMVIVAFRGHALEVTFLVIEHNDPAACPRVCVCKCLYIVCVRVTVCACVGSCLPSQTRAQSSFPSIQ